MNQVLLWLQSIRLRLPLTSFWVVTVLLISSAIDYRQPLAAQAKSITPETLSYQVARTDGENAQEQDGLPNKKLIEKSQQQLKNRADNVREKLNVAQPTKEFLDTVQDKGKEAVKGIGQSVENTTHKSSENQ
ncbi:MAG TPA: hypothetical protein V6D14_32255 [Coleofasciculaceae cyanobacterium]|jgi:hypothetical protein